MTGEIESIAKALSMDPFAFRKKYASDAPFHTCVHLLRRTRRACQEELAHLWDDLHMAARSAIRPGTWTIECKGLEERIKELTKLVGPTHWEQVQITLLEKGIYQRIHADLGIEVEVDMNRVQEVRAHIEAGALKFFGGKRP